jgi:regulator of sigma D
VLQGEFEAASSRIYTKYKKVSYIALDEGGASRRHCDMLIDKTSDGDSHFYSRTREDLKQEEEEFYRKHLPRPALSKLKQLVDSCNVFQQSEKLEALKKEKLVSTFCQDEADYSSLKTVAKENLGPFTPGNLDPGTARML